MCVCVICVAYVVVPCDFDDVCVLCCVCVAVAKEVDIAL